MVMDRCAAVLRKAFCPLFRDHQWLLFHRRCSNLTCRAASLLPCHHPSLLVRQSHNSAGFVSCQKLEHRSLVHLSGSDVLGFLQGLVTNDVQRLQTDGSAMYAMMLNFQGRVMYDLILYRLKADELTVFIECQYDVTSDLISNLLKYKLRKMINITDVGNDFSVWSVFSESRDMPDLHVTNKDTVLCVSDPRHASFGCRLLLPSSSQDLTFSGCSVIPGDYHLWRCQAGVGEGTIDFPPTQSFPLEANLDFMNGVSFSKGCYVGQELTARTNYTGVIRKRIMPLVISRATQDIQPGAVVFNASGKECGKVRSAFGPRALGLLRIDDVVGKGRLEVRVDDSKIAEAETYVPSWWPTASDAVIQHAVARSERTSSKD